jgi:putative GTP pyrophosphokinase
MKKALLRLVDKTEPLIISQRLKRITSIEYKLDLNKNMVLAVTQDIGRYRAIIKETNNNVENMAS